MRGHGRVFRRKNSAFWWIEYHHRGKEFRESSRSIERKDAERLLKRRLQEIGADALGVRRFIGPSQERLTFQELADDYLRDREVNGRRSSRWATAALAHLRATFGLDRAVDMTTPRIRAYQADRLKDGAAAGTVNRELSVLGRIFSLAIESERLSVRPNIPKLEESAPRQGFFEHSEYLAVRAHLPAPYQDVLDFAYYSGWRRGEIMCLEWRDVDRAAQVIQLRPELSKNKEGRVLALSGSRHLTEVIERRWQARALGCPFVFHVNTRRVGDWRKTWAKACIAAGFFRVVGVDAKGRPVKVPTKLFHDLRRTVVRNLVRAGVPERIAMGITGHKTRSVFDRYNIVREADLAEGGARLADYIEGLNSTPTVVPFARREQSGS